jgi:hypothetical protein
MDRADRRKDVMSTPLDLAVDIAGALSLPRADRGPVNARALARDISRRHADTGYSNEDIEAAIVEVGARTGVPFAAPLGR